MGAQAQDLEAGLDETIKKQKDIRMLEVTALKLLTFYIICQGLLLWGVMAGSSSDSFTCRQFWLVFGMSFVMVIAYFIKLLGILILHQRMLMQRVRGIVFMSLLITVFIIVTVFTLVALRMILC